ncbi:hypothetical protein AB0F11_27670 [Streptomyces sp. NPDC032472]|uniref:hypothetical protein n=1 Tax=Streptomyces sp. NPDC032472 TaxID=3155018 RepID=UPI0033DA1A80
MSSKTARFEPRRGYTHVRVTLRQDAPATWPAEQDAADDAEVSFALSIPHDSRTGTVSEADGHAPARLVDELLGCAAGMPRESVNRMLASSDVHEARLGRAVRALQQTLGAPGTAAPGMAAHGSSAPARAEGTAIDPVTHDPGW